MSAIPANQPEPSPQVDQATCPLSVYDLTVAYHRKPVIWDVAFEIPEGSLVGVVGYVIVGYRFGGFYTE